MLRWPTILNSTIITCGELPYNYHTITMQLLGELPYNKGEMEFIKRPIL